MNTVATKTEVLFALYSPGTKVPRTRWRRGYYGSGPTPSYTGFRYSGPRGWYCRVQDKDSLGRLIEVREVLMKRKRYRAINVVTFATYEEAEREAFMLVMRHPEWIGCLEVRKGTLDELR